LAFTSENPVIKSSYNQNAEIGGRVVFENDHGPQIGILINVLRDIGNAQLFALVEVDGIPPGAPRLVPVADLQPI